MDPTSHLRSLTHDEQLIGENVFRTNFGLKTGEHVVIVTDTDKADPEASLFFESAKRFTNKLTYIIMDPASENAQEPPDEVARYLLDADVALLITTFSLSHTQARKYATEKGARIASMPGITHEMILRTLAIDYGEIARRSKSVAAILTKGEKAYLSGSNGTLAVFGLGGRTSHADTGFMTNPGDFSNLPAGEAFIAPTQGKTDGIIFFDGCFADITLDRPIKVIIEHGHVVDIGGGEGARLLNSKLSKIGKLGYNVAELGVGTNPMAKLTSGSILEVEKVFETVHVALGNNATIGGEVDVPFHSDGVILKPTLKVDDTVILKEGKFQL